MPSISACNKLVQDIHRELPVEDLPIPYSANQKPVSYTHCSHVYQHLKLIHSDIFLHSL